MRNQTEKIERVNYSDCKFMSKKRSNEMRLQIKPNIFQNIKTNPRINQENIIQS